MNFEGCRCPHCGYVTMVLIEYYDTKVVGTCNECGKMYEAIPHPQFKGTGTVLLNKYNPDNYLKG